MTLTAPKPDEHLGILAEIFAKTFSNYWERVAYVHDGYIAESSYDWDASRIAVIDGEVAAHLGVWDMQMRIGGSTLRVAGIGAVATLEHHRGKGLMAKTASDCIAGLGAAGYDVSLLFGIPNFYHRFGYAVCFPEITTAIDTKNVPAMENVAPYARFDGSPVELAELYNHENARVTGTYVRPTYRRNRRPKTEVIYTFKGGYVCAGPHGSILQVSDCVGDPATVLEIVRREAVAAICPQIEFVFLPPRSRTGEHLRTLPHTTRVSRGPNGGPMLKIVDLARTFEKVSPELSERMSAGPMADHSGVLEIESGGDSVKLAIERGTLRVDRGASGTGSRLVDGTALPRLLVGDGDPAANCRRYGAKLEGDARHLIPILFPDQEPSTILWDRF